MSNEFTSHSLESMTLFKSHCLTDRSLDLVLDITVNNLHCEKDAVLSPKPNLPKSLLALFKSGSLVANLMASFSSPEFIPKPSSKTHRIASGEDAEYISIF